MSRAISTASSSSSSSSTPPTAKRCRLERTPSALTPRSKAMLRIPHSPSLEKLGYGTGVNVFLYRRVPVTPSPTSSSSSSSAFFLSPWAIKKLRGGGGGGGRGGNGRSVLARRLEREAGILRSLEHPNIIGYRGFRRNSDGSRVLAVENGEKSLLDVIEEIREYEEEEGGEEEDPEPLPHKVILKVVGCVASALSYLHNKKQLLHGDIKGANVLIKGDFEDVKLCDFGVALKLDENLKVSEEEEEAYVGTGPFTALEALNGGGDRALITDRADIFSLGCLIYEMLALEAPHVNLLRFEEDNESDQEEAEEAYEDALGTRPDLPEHLDWLAKDEGYKKVLGIFYACTEEDPAKRPSARDIVDLLKD